ncbi:MAG: asparagine synthase (glutamine-hydrolyzing) [Firmicutes bacterium]|nr:asparagine synthase (glutamine-hydrolyzing) [Bacillota bacterium]MCL2256020.1 asparagine synthase (glutamine-hydrolyzing) [Bacillota bacterium]
MCKISGTFNLEKRFATFLESDHPPMRLKLGDKKYMAVATGELFNAKEIRRELASRGHVLQSDSLAEIILHLYSEHKENFLHKLNGVFSVAIFEEHSKRLFLARDRIGVKPFFYHIKNNTISFASDPQTLFLDFGVKPSLDENAIAEIMLLGPGKTPRHCGFKNVNELLGGHFAYFSDDGFKEVKYWDLTHREHTDSFDETSEKVRFLVEDSIKRQLGNTPTIATFLSGGLDSSIITSVAKRELGAISTFSVDYEENDLHFQSSKFTPESDLSYIEKMHSFLGDGSKHHRIVLKNEDLVSAIYDAVDARGFAGMGDIDASLLLFSKEARKHVGCALSGECADEIFGGYPWFRDEKMRNIDGFPWNTFNRFEFLHDDLKDTIEKDYAKKRYDEAISNVHVLFGTSPLEKRMKEMSKLNFDHFMQTLVVRGERMGMFGGINIRTPFCDYRIAEYLYNVPWEFKDYLGREKGLLRHAMKDYLPHDVLYRKKSPYPKTHNPKYLELVRNELKEVLNDSSSPLLKIANKKALESLLTSTSQTPWYGQLMTTPQTIAYFLQVNYWLRKYF